MKAAEFSPLSAKRTIFYKSCSDPGYAAASSSSNTRPRTAPPTSCCGSRATANGDTPPRSLLRTRNSVPDVRHAHRVRLSSCRYAVLWTCRHIHITTYILPFVSTRAGGAGLILSGRPSPRRDPVDQACAAAVKGAALPRDRRSRAATRRGKALSIASMIEDPPFDGSKPADTRFPCVIEHLPIRGIDSARHPLRVG
jgi:hypothetical protein